MRNLRKFSEISDATPTVARVNGGISIITLQIRRLHDGFSSSRQVVLWLRTVHEQARHDWEEREYRVRTWLLSEELQPAVRVSTTQTLAERVANRVLLGELERCNRRRLTTTAIPVAI